MRLLFMSYVNTASYSDPKQWLHRIRGYLGVLEALSKQHVVMSIEQINYTGQEVVNGVHYYFYNNRRNKTYFPRRLHKIVKSLKPDVIVVHGLSYPLQILQLRIEMGKHCKIIAQSHAERIPMGYRRVIQRLADNCIDSYLFTSACQANEWLAQRLINRKEKVKEVMVGSSVFVSINKEEARKKLGLQETRIFLWVGRLDKNKDPITLINAFLEFSALHVGVALYMIHQSEELLDKVKNLLDQFSGSAIKLIGRVPHDDMALWYNSADYIVSSSHDEAFGLSVVEGMSCGCVPVVTDIPSLTKITGGVCGLRYEPGNAKGLLRCLVQTQEINLHAEKQKVLERFNQCLSFDAIAMEMDKIIQAL